MPITVVDTLEGATYIMEFHIITKEELNAIKAILFK
jgi:hypothetical protein